MSDRPIAPAATRRNFWLSILNGAVMIGTSNSVASPELVLTPFAAYLTNSRLLLGLIAPLQNATWFLPQLWIVSRVQRAKRSMPIYNYAAFLRLLGWIALAGAALLTHNPVILLLTVTLFVLIAGTAAGVAGLPFIEVIGKVIPPRQRGLVFGWRGAVGGVLAIVGAQVVILFTGPDAHFNFPTNYALLFIFAGITQMLGFFVFSLVKEPDSETIVERPRLSRAVLKSVWSADDNFRRFVQGRTSFELSSMANGLVIVYANQVLGVRLELAGLYLLVSSVLRPIFSIAAGRMSVRIGNRLPVAAGLIAQAMGWGLLLLALPLDVHGRTAEYYLIPVYSLIAIQKGLIFSNLMALGLNVTPDEDRPLYMGALNTWLGFVTLSGALSGVIADVIGFGGLFSMSLILSCLGAWQFWTLREQMDIITEKAAAAT